MEKGTYTGRRVDFSNYAVSFFNPYLFTGEIRSRLGCGPSALALLTGLPPEVVAAKNGGQHTSDAFVLRFLRARSYSVLPLWPAERKRDDSDLFLELFKRAAPLGMALLFAQFWLRPLDAWAIPRGSVNKKIKSLVNHLFVKYAVPEFLYDNWICKRRDRFSDYGTHYTDRSDLPVLKWAVWLILMGQGASLHRGSRHFGWNIAQSFESHLLRCPPIQTPVQAVMWAEIARLGGGTPECNRLLQNSSFIIDPTAQLERNDFLPFWRATVQWLTLHREAISDVESQLILDWGMHLFTEARRAGGAPFSWAGRSPNRVAALALEYRESRERFRPGHDLRWQNRGWNWDFESPSGIKWSFVELVSGKELFEEGRWMQHCVGSYAHLCAAGHSAIFSLRQNGKRAITIELNPRSKRLAQVRGERNRGATDEEQSVVDQWCMTVVNGYSVTLSEAKPRRTRFGKTKRILPSSPFIQTRRDSVW